MVVGAGVSGLVCARRLSQVGLNVVLVDKSHSVGGRIQTDTINGFQLDRGFQVLLTAYPSLLTELDVDSLELRKFEPGCLVWDGKKLREVHKDAIIQMLVDRWLPIGDMAKTVTMAMDLRQAGSEGIWGMADQSIESCLRGRGFSEKYLDRFVRPFFGGVMGDRSLSGSCLPFLYYWSMFDQGEVAVPAFGMGEITKQLVLSLGGNVEVRLGIGVKSILRHDGYVNGVELESGERISADAVVVATDSLALADLTNAQVQRQFNAFTTVYFEADHSPIQDPILITNGTELGRVNHVAPMSKVSPNLAPAGRHLVSATLLSNPKEDDVTLAQSVQYELKDWFPDIKVSDWSPLSIQRVPLGQMVQSVGFMDCRPQVNPESGLYLAGESTTYAGLDGAIKSGQLAASGVLSWFKEPAVV